MKKLFFLSLLLFTTVITFSQQSILTITGKVVNAENKQPMQGASVFAESTTIGTATDADGNFTLKLPAGGYNIVVTFTGYNTQDKHIGNTDRAEINFELSPKLKSMEEVAVVATGEVKNGWEKYGAFFLEEFIGKTSNSTLCSIKNPESLKFFYSKRKNRLKILSNEPILIENNALGYTIKYELDSFVHEYNTDLTVYTGFPLFQEIPFSDSTQYNNWKTARLKAYFGSVLHFMRSLYDMQLQEQGFEIQFIVKNKESDTAIRLSDFYKALNFESFDSVNIVTFRPNQPSMGVLYVKEKPSEDYIRENKGEPAAFQFSTLLFQNNEKTTIEQNGYFFDQNNITTNGYWSWIKMAEALPYDYEPDDLTTE